VIGSPTRLDLPSPSKVDIHLYQAIEGKTCQECLGVSGNEWKQAHMIPYFFSQLNELLRNKMMRTGITNVNLSIPRGELCFITDTFN